MGIAPRRLESDEVAVHQVLRNFFEDGSDVAQAVNQEVAPARGLRDSGQFADQLLFVQRVALGYGVNRNACGRIVSRVAASLEYQL